MQRNKIYLRAGTGLMVLFIIIVYTITSIKSKHVYRNMKSQYRSNSIILINEIYHGAQNDLLKNINQIIERNGLPGTYSSVLLIDENKRIITRFGNSFSNTKKDKRIINECDDIAFEFFNEVSTYGHGVSTSRDKHGKFEYAEVILVNTNGEKYYLLIGVQGYYLLESSKTLIPAYVFFLILILILFHVVTNSFIKIFKVQNELESNRQNLMIAIAHEIKTPLGTIRSFSEGLKERIKEDKKEHYLNVIIDETEQISLMVSDMNELSILESGIELKLQNYSFTQIVEQVLSRYREIIKSKGIIIEYNYTDNCIINCDAVLIEKVIANLLSNAIQHTPVNGNISIKIEGNNKYTVFSIVNSGLHIPFEKISQIWDAFYKTDTARSNQHGTGLGLSIVKGILVAHDFEYGVENVELGVRFWFRFETF